MHLLYSTFLTFFNFLITILCKMMDGSRLKCNIYLQLSHPLDVVKSLQKDPTIQMEVRRGGSFVAHQTSGSWGPRFKSGISHNEPDALQDHCVIM